VKVDSRNSYNMIIVDLIGSL